MHCSHDITQSTKPSQTKSTKPNQTKPNPPHQTKPNQTKPNQTKPNQTKPTDHPTPVTCSYSAAMSSPLDQITTPVSLPGPPPTLSETVLHPLLSSIHALVAEVLKASTSLAVTWGKRDVDSGRRPTTEA